MVSDSNSNDNTSKDLHTTANTLQVNSQVKESKNKSHLKEILLIIGGALLLIGLGLAYLFYTGFKDTPKVESKISNFMQNTSNNNIDGAYELTSKDFKKDTSKDEFTRAMNLFKGQYTGFESIKSTGFNIKKRAGEPTLFNYSGKVTYNNGDEGDLTAVLIKEDGEYKILNIEIFIDLKRSEKFQQQNNNSVLGAQTSK